MKQLILWIFMAAIGLVACNSKDNHTGDVTNQKDDTDNPINAINKKPILTGSFIDFWDKDGWDVTQWKTLFGEMKDLGMNTGIIQFAAYESAGGSYTWFDSENDYTSQKFPKAMSDLLNAASEENFDIHIGLYFNEEYWHNQTNASWLELHANRCIELANEIQDQFGYNPAFKGWYIPHEPEPYAYGTPEKAGLFRNQFVNKISDHLHSLNDKPVSIAAFFNQQLSSSDQVKGFMTELAKSNLQIIMLQDGVGVGHLSLDNIGSYYEAATKGVFENNTGFQGEFWTDLETFAFPEAPPNSVDRIKVQLESELGVKEVTKAVSFQYYSDMSLIGNGGENAVRLHNDYVGYLNTLE